MEFLLRKLIAHGILFGSQTCQKYLKFIALMNITKSRFQSLKLKHRLKNCKKYIEHNGFDMVINQVILGGRPCGKMDGILEAFTVLFD